MNDLEGSRKIMAASVDKRSSNKRILILFVLSGAVYAVYRHLFSIYNFHRVLDESWNERGKMNLLASSDSSDEHENATPTKPVASATRETKTQSQSPEDDDDSIASRTTNGQQMQGTVRIGDATSRGAATTSRRKNAALQSRLRNAQIRVAEITESPNIPLGDMQIPSSLYATEKGTRLAFGDDVKTAPLFDKKRASEAMECVFHPDERCILSNRVPARIPMFIHGSNKSYFGYVFRDLAARVLHVDPQFRPSSTVVVVSNDAETTLEMAKPAFSGLEGRALVSKELELRRQINYSVGGTFILQAVAAGHIVHGIPPRQLDNEKMFATNREGPTRLLLLNPEINDEDELATKISNYVSMSDIDYIVSGFHIAPQNQVGGMSLILQLISQNYRVQVLSFSHHSDGAKWRQNVLLTKENLPHFQEWARSLIHSNDEVFRGYVFATKSFDFAIPSRKAIIPEPPSQTSVPYLNCTTHSSAQLSFSEKHPDNLKSLNVQCGLRVLRYRDKIDLVKSIWYNGANLNNSEAVCVKVDCGKPTTETACTSRVLAKQATRHESGKLNLLMIELDSVSAARFDRYFPQTVEIMEGLKFQSFENHAALSQNSLQNARALYSGQLNDGDEQSKRLWETLSEQGYSTFVGEDLCDTNKRVDMDASTAMHGHFFQEMFCQDFGRPNCAGSKSAAEHLVEYTNEFIQTYENQLWAAFLRFSGTREDSYTLAGSIDSTLASLLIGLNNTRNFGRDMREDTAIVFVSTEGINYGAYFQTQLGRAEVVKPFFHFYLPQRYTNQRDAISENSKLWTSAGDVFTTIRHVLMDQPAKSLASAGLSNDKHEPRRSCKSAGIPVQYCDLLENKDPGIAKQRLLPEPPSVFSFYADIPQQRRFQAESCSDPSEDHLFTPGSTCLCTTSSREWFECTEHPWGEKKNRDPKEYFLLIQCDGKMHYETRVAEDPAILSRSKSILLERDEPLGPPNVLFLEIDSVSRSNADRSLPKTRDLLRLFRVGRKGEGGCRDEVCSFDFTRFSVVGANSNPNQIAALGGCIVTVIREACNSAKAQVGDICKDKTKRELGLQLVKVHRQYTTWCPVDSRFKGGEFPEPYLFDIASKSGYVTMFGEEFCYEGSPYCPQGNLYPMQADILVHEVFCRMASRRAMIDRWKKPWELWKLSMGDGNHMKMCLLDEEKALYKSKVALEHIEQMWEAYSETPKFAFLNSIIAHSYHSDESKVNVPTEQYDEMLSQFLKRLLESKSAKRTIIVVRSDHGLQDGPFRVDYSLQTEALRPWTELVVPKGLPGFDVRKLAENQDSLVTGFDLYHTLAKTIGARSPDKISVPSGWSYHLWKEIVPNHRTCSDARIPSDFCFFEEEHSNSTISPNFGTCNRGEQNQFIFCHVRRKYMQKKLATHSIKLVEKQELWMSLDKAIYDEGDAEADMRIRPSSWQEIDKIVAQSQNKQVSGGIFLYPRQMALLRNVVAYLAKTMGIGAGSRSRDELRRLRVCETGFGAGHSAALFLNASESLVLYSFDKFDRNYQIDAAFYLNSTYQNRLITRAGDSCRTVPQSLSSEGSGNQTDGLIHCDFLHGSSLCNRDNIDLVENSPCGIILTSTAMFSLYDKDVYFGERAQWNNLIQRGCIKDVACFEERPTQVKGNFVFAEDGDVMKSVFCIAVTTGLCRRNTPPEGEIDLTCHDKISRITRKLDVSNLAKRFQVPLCIAGDDAGEKGDFRHSLAKKDSNQRQPKDTKRRAIQNESRQSKRTQKVALQVPLSIVRDGVEERDAFRSSLTKQDGIPS